MKVLAYTLLGFLLISCGTAVVMDYEKGTDFSKYSTYNYFPNIDSGLNELDNKRIMTVTDSLLQQRGLSRSENPQFLINFFAKEYLSNSRNTIGIGIGGGGGNVGVGVSGGIPIGGKVVNQQFTMDFIDATQDGLFWQGVLESDYKENVRPEERELYYEKIISKILAKYPPVLK